MQIQYLSASRLNTYVDCEFKYFLQYHIKLPELKKDTVHTTKGKAVHEALENWANGNKDYVKSLKDYYAASKLWELDNRKPNRGFPHPVEKDCANCPFATESSAGTICAIAQRKVDDFDGCPRPNFEDDVALVEKSLGNKEFPLHSKVLGAEVPFDFTFDNFRIHGFIDLIIEVDDETIEVVDYKAGTYAKKHDDALKDFQMRIYSLVAKKLFPKYKYVVMTLYYLRKEPVTVIFDDKKDQETYDFLARAYKQISENDNPRQKRSFKCSWCIGYEACSAIKENYTQNGKFVMPPPVTESEPEEVEVD